MTRLILFNQSHKIIVDITVKLKIQPNILHLSWIQLNLTLTRTIYIRT